MPINVPNSAPATVSQNVCIFPSILLWATNAAIKYASVEVTTLSIINVIAVAIANAKAEWPLGIPPFRGVPVAVNALTTTTAINTNTIQINVTWISDFLIVYNKDCEISVSLS